MGDSSSRSGENGPELDATLVHWELAGASVLRRLPGSALRCVLGRGAERFVLRQVRGDRAYLDYQIRVLDHLALLDFPYAVPRPLPTRDGTRIVGTADGDWILYRWIDGRPAPRPITLAQAADLGRLVGETGRALGSFSLGGHAGYFRLPLFCGARAAERVTESTRWLADHHPRRRLAAGLRAYGEGITRAATEAAARADAVAGLATPTIYDDWHRRNLLARHGRLVGLVDFDSLVEAPRLVDLGNALTHLLASVPVRRMARLAAFAAAYGPVCALSTAEAELATAVLWDRLVDLLAALLDALRATDRFDASAGLAGQLVRFGAWLLGREAGVTATLLDHATGPARS